jgi:hypothetical protein
MYSESQVSNAVVSHKDNLISWIDNSNRREFNSIMQALNCVKLCWERLDYGYKWNELVQRLHNKHRP